MIGTKKYSGWHIAITVIAAALFIPFLGAVHLFDWDEINFAECAREMLVTHNYSQVQINFQPFWEKPPLFIWLQVLSMKLFGVNEFAARFPDAICGIITLNLTYYLGRKYNNHTFGLLWTLCYAASFLPFLYFKTGIIDPWFNLFIFLSICFLLQWFNNNSKKTNINAVYAGLFAGLAILTKGPVALLIIGLTFLVVWFRLKLNPFANLKNLVLFIVVFLITGLSWFIFEILNGNLAVLKEFIEYQVRLFNTHDSGHEGFRLYHFVILLIGCFPASIFFIPAHTKNPSDTPFQVYTKQWMLILFWVVLIIFTIVNTKIVHYSSMCYFPLTYLAAYKLHDIIYSRKQLNRIVFSLGLFLIIVLGMAFIAAGLIKYFIPAITNSNLIADKFAIASLQTPVTWLGFEWVVGLLFLVFSIYFFVNLHKSKKYIYGLFATSLVSIWMITLLIVPKIEPYSQGPAIEFYESLKGKDVYVETIGFKSYAYMFYTDRQPQHNSPAMLKSIKEQEIKLIKEGNAEAVSFNLMSLTWMLLGDIDKPAYFAAKITDDEEIKKNHPNLIKLYHKGGFIFYKRLPNIH
ncbi:MAG TPA: glycosyltransferase family 39 protein [Bacteroidia bacterium]|nr:glycosyltransferase family 39 protein [Bacteroidia bacterium]